MIEPEMRQGIREMTTNIGRDKNQPLTSAYLHEIFRNLESGDGKGFFEHVANDVDWMVEGAWKFERTSILLS